MRNLNYLLIILGAFVALYAESGNEQNLFILIGGISMLMIGIYRVSKTIPSKFDNKEDEENNEIN